MITFIEGSYYLGFWFVPGVDKDWLGAIWRQRRLWTFRSYVRPHSPESPKPFDDQDTKSGVYFQLDADSKTEEEIIQDVAVVAGLIGQQVG